ncbi:MAG: serine/threonine-protein kinase [Eubacterium sp.]|nr:serine/threonine-protein kinase [Eubacterium sp.]
MAKIGTVIDGKYEIITEIGRGGMSVVYLAMDRRLRKQWAVKEAKKKPGPNSNIFELTPIAEANLLKSLDHPNIVRIVDIVEQDGYIYIVEDFVEGKSLAEEVKHGPSSPEKVIEWGTQLCDVLEYLHTRNPRIIYRDMKPANVQLQPDGKTIKLLDFGIAKRYKPQKTSDTTNLGTRGYAAPEQFDSKKQSDPRTDVFSLGITLKSLLTGKTPYDAEFYGDIEKLNPAVTDGLVKVIAKATAQDREKRYQSAAEFKYALNHYHDRDDAVVRIRKRKLASYRVLIASAISFFVIGSILLPVSALVKNSDYNNYLSEGKYERCIELNPTRTEAYEKFIENAGTNEIISITKDSVYNNYTQIRNDTQRKNIALEFALAKEEAFSTNRANGLESANVYYRSLMDNSISDNDFESESFDIGNYLDGNDMYSSIAAIKRYYNAIYSQAEDYSKNPEATSAKNIDNAIKNLGTIKEFVEKNKDEINRIGEIVFKGINDSNSLYDYLVVSQCNCIIDDNNKNYFLSDSSNIDEIKEKCFFNGDSKSDRLIEDFRNNT